MRPDEANCERRLGKGKKARDLRLEAPGTVAKSGKQREWVKDAAPLPREKPVEVCLLPPYLRHFFATSTISIAVFFLIDLLSAGPGARAESAKRPAAALPTLTTTRQAHSLTSEQAKRAYPIHLQAVVTYYDPDLSSGYAALFVHDSTGGIYVKLRSGSIKGLSPGTLVDVRGVSDPGSFAPYVIQPQIRVTGHSQLPADAPQKSFTRLMSGAEDGQWIEAEGVIHSVFAYGHVVMLQMAMADGTLSVMMVSEPGAAYSRLVDAKVRIRANAAPLFNPNGQMIGVRLMAPGLSAVEVVEPAPRDPFKQPAILVDNLLRWNQVNASIHRVRLRGKVTLQWPGSSLCIRDATGGICAQTAQDTHLALGDDADVVGFAGTEGDAPVLTDAVFRLAGKGAPVAAEPITTEEALLGKHDFKPIQIDGQLIGYDPASSDTTLLLTSGKVFFAAILPNSLAESKTAPWKIGSKLRISGICSVRLQSSSLGEGVAQAKSFRVLMRSPQDVIVIERASWWTPGHTVLLLAFGFAATLGVLAWVVVLRRRVEQQANLLRESAGRFRHMALHDALTGLATRLLLQDRLNTAVEAADRHHRGLALLMVDLDEFKEINDTYGHKAGDEVLCATADRLLEAVRKSDTVARVGGDEFVVLLTDLNDPQIAERIAANIVATLAVPIPFEEFDLPISVSVGVCAASAWELDADAMMKNADAALYQAKESGRNRYRMFTPEAYDA
jgi:diguanylate cyclase (GGDEF)-like protein